MMAEARSNRRLIGALSATALAIVLTAITSIVALRSSIHVVERDAANAFDDLVLIHVLELETHQLAFAKRKTLDGGAQQPLAVALARFDMTRERWRVRVQRSPELEVGEPIERMLAEHVTRVMRASSPELADVETAAALEHAIAASAQAVRTRFDASKERSQQLAVWAQWAIVFMDLVGVVLGAGFVIAMLRAMKGQASRARRTADILQRTTNERREFLNATIELREPLGAILDAVRALRERTLREPAASRHLDQIAHAASVANGQLAQFMDLS
ncbi:MAG: hypothetical protein H0T79_10140, partial [Deltaproteobacteria bacterium]|nr:hypothetical protein [Deltaproteobacteria bacterium]